MKTKRIFACILSLFVLLSVACFLVGCVDEEEPVEKSNVAVMISQTESGNIDQFWMVPADEDSLDIELECGAQYKFRVHKLNFPDHPDMGDIWFGYSPLSSDIEVNIDYYFLASYGKWVGRHYIEEYRGEYKVIIDIGETVFGKPKRIELHITVI